jgi:ATP-dependent DNA helicase PIF1
MAMQSLNAQQHTAVELARSGASFFLTGGAGTGKSFAVATICLSLETMGKHVSKTASTGVAALLLGGGGTTVHSWSGMGLGDLPVHVIVAKASRAAVQRVRVTDVLVIDEISMMHPEFFSKLEDYVRRIRKCELPMGGIQLIVVGDFMQLPPVGAPPEAPFCFQTKAWGLCLTKMVRLTQIYRQTDGPWATLLNRMRLGQIMAEDVQTLQDRVGAVFPEDGIEPTMLRARNSQADVLNANKLAALPGREDVHLSKTVCGIKRNPGLSLAQAGPIPSPDVYNKLIDDRTPAPATLKLRVGASVMLLKNLDLDAGLANGSLGVVKCLSPVTVSFIGGVQRIIGKEVWDFKFEHGNYVCSATVEQYPLQLAWALTIHKIQGASLDRASIALDRSLFECGHAYVALSRLKTLNGLQLTAFDPACIKAHPHAALMV